MKSIQEMFCRFLNRIEKYLYHSTNILLRIKHLLREVEDYVAVALQVIAFNFGIVLSFEKRYKDAVPFACAYAFRMRFLLAMVCTV